MGRARVEQPQKIAQKLRQIRLNLEMTQEEMANTLEKNNNLKIYRGYVGLFEIGERIPSILTILAYARIAKIPMEILCDDELELPKKS